MTDTEFSPAEHSQIGGSTSPNIVKCPGSLRLLRQHPELDVDNAGAAAREGTLLHEVIARLMDGQECDPGFEIDVGGHKLTYTEGMREYQIAPALRAIDQFEEEYGALDEYELEVTVSFPGIAGAFGTTDLVGGVEIDGEKWALIGDWKFGYNDVPVEENMSLAYYACGARADKRTAHFFEGAVGVLFVIVQPKGEPILKVWKTDAAFLDEFEMRLKNSVMMASDPDHSIDEIVHEGESQCMYCKVATVCPAKQNKAATLLAAFREMKETAEIKGDNAPAEPAEALDNDTLAAYLIMLEELAPFEKALRSTAHARLEQGQTVGDYGLKAKQTRRAWIDEEKTIARMRQWGYKMPDYTERKVFSPAAIESLLKARGDEKRLKRLDKLITRTESSGFNLVRGAANEFTERAAAIADALARQAGERTDDDQQLALPFSESA